MLERLAVDKVDSLNEDIVPTHIRHVLNSLHFILQAIEADIFLNINIKQKNTGLEESDKDSQYIQSIISYFFNIPETTLSSSSEGNFLEILRSATIALLQHRNRCVTSSSSNLAIQLFPNEATLQLITSLLGCLNRMHRLDTSQIFNNNNATDTSSTSTTLTHKNTVSSKLSMSVARFHELWCLSRLVITSLGGGEVKTCSLTDPRSDIEPLLDETLELVGFLSSHTPKHLKQQLKKSHSNNSTSKIEYKFSKSEIMSLVRELICLPFSVFVTRPQAIYPCLLSLVLSPSASSITKRCEIGREMIRGRFSYKHFTMFLADLRDEIIMPKQISQKMVQISPLVPFSDLVDGDSGNGSVAGDHSEEGGEQEEQPLSSSRSSASNALKVCAVADICWEEWDEVARGLAYC
jgi:hypothetical protein